MMSILAIFRNRNYTLLFIANFTSQMGGIIGLTAFLYFLLDRFTNKPAYGSMAELMYSLPMLVVFVFIGVVADRFDRTKIAANSDYICAVLSLALIFSAIYEQVVLMFLLLFVRSAISKFFQPAQAALIQGILKEEEYTVAAGLNQMISSIFMLFGSAFGIFIYWKFGIVGAILIDGLSFIVSGLLIRSCVIEKKVRLPNGSNNWRDLNIKTIIADFKTGFNYIFTNKLLLSLVFGFFIFGIVNGGLAVMPAFIMKYKLAPESYETLMMWHGVIFGSGVLISSAITSSIVSKFKLYQLIITGIFITGGALALSGLTTNVYSFFALTFIAAIGLPFINIGIGGWMPKIIDPKMMGRVQGCVSPLNMLSQSLTLGVIALAFPHYLSIEWLFLLIGLILSCVGAFYWLTLPKYSKNDKASKDSNYDVLELD